MKTILKSLSLLGLAAVALAPLARADEPAAAATPAPTGEHHRPDRAAMRAHRLQKLDEHLQLSDAQKQRIQTIWSQAEEEGRALHDNDALSKDDRRAKMKDLRQTTRDQVRGVLTPEQQKTFDTMPKDGHGHRGPRRGDGDGDNAGAKSDDDAPPTKG